MLHSWFSPLVPNGTVHADESVGGERKETKQKPLRIMDSNPQQQWDVQGQELPDSPGLGQAGPAVSQSHLPTTASSCSPL